MATNHTKNYGLNLWEPEDAFLRAEFNENSEKLDAAVGTLARTVARKGDCQIVTGSYIGDGTFGEEHPITLTFSKTPILIFVAGNDYMGWMLRGCRVSSPVYGSNGAVLNLTWLENGVSFYTDHFQRQMNTAGEVTRYVALVEA